MAQRRMFSMQIVDSDAFLDMPLSSQVLYFHLAMRADDDGFVSNPKKIMRMIGSQDDDYKVLIAKRFIIPFEAGICVIKHWKIHNYIRKDTYNETRYLEEKQTLIEKDNGSYTERGRVVDESSPQVRLGKVRLGKVSIEKTAYGEFQNVELTETEYSNLVDSLNEEAVLSLIAELDGYIESTGKRYKSHYATLQNWARRRITEHKQSNKPKRQIL